MAFWLKEHGNFYLPPAKPNPRVLNTDEYVTGTNIYFTANTDRLLTVGHPYFAVRNEQNEITVPKVSGNQYRVFRLKCPDPNQFALIDPKIFNPEKERLVWGLKGIEVSRGGPLGIGSTGHPLFNKYTDTENMSVYPPAEAQENRMNISMDPKLTQLFIVGCSPPLGEYWDKAKFCADHNVTKGDCPPLELISEIIEDGDMMDIGFGNMNNKTLYEGRSGVPLDIINDKTKWPDFVKMAQDVYGDQMFFFGRREQIYSRHQFNRAGTVGDIIPMENTDFFLNPKQADPAIPQKTISSSIYVTIPSGSLNSSDGQLFNKPFWLKRAQGNNNGILWRNDLFVTVGDNTRNTNFNISVYKESGTLDTNYIYTASDFKNYTRHVEEFEISIVLELCKVKLDADILAHLNVMDPGILENWKLAFVPPPQVGIEDNYRFIESLATRCPTEADKHEPEDPYKDKNFWTVDITEKFTSELSQSSLGRRFLFQSNILGNKRPRSEITVPASRDTSTRRTVKRRKLKR